MGEGTAVVYPLGVYTCVRVFSHILSPLSPFQVSLLYTYRKDEGESMVVVMLKLVVDAVGCKETFLIMAHFVR